MTRRITDRKKGMITKEHFPNMSEYPPNIWQPNAYPLSWHLGTRTFQDVWQASLNDYWRPEDLPWDTLDVEGYNWEERECIAYWWTRFSVFDVLSLPVFAQALIEAYETHEEDSVRKCLFSVLNDKQNHEALCGLMIRKLLEHPDPLTYEPKTDLGLRLQKNARWLYFNGARHWDGQRHATPESNLVVLFSYFLMDGITASTAFRQMYENSPEPVFKEAFKKIGRDENRLMAICLAIMERDGLDLSQERKAVAARRIRSGSLFLSAMLFEPSPECWDLPEDFTANQYAGEKVARDASFGILSYDVRLQNWKTAMIHLKGILDRYEIPFPTIPEIGIAENDAAGTGMQYIVPTFSAGKPVPWASRAH